MDKSLYKNIWVYVELTEGKAAKVSLELLGEARKIADASGEKLVAVIISDAAEKAIDEISNADVDEIIVVQGQEYKHYSTDAYTFALTQLCKKYNPSALFMGATDNGKDMAPRLSARLDTGSIADTTELYYNPETKDIEWTKPAFGGNLMATIVCEKSRPQIGTIRQGVFKAALPVKRDNINIIREKISTPLETIRTIFKNYTANESTDDIKIEDAEVIVAIGRGVKNQEQIAVFKELADLLGGAIAVTRPIVDCGWYSVKCQVGQSGKIVSPKLYIACGISGAVQHTAGMTSSDVIIAINSDKSAPIFGFADYAVVGDMFEVVPALIDEIKALKGI
ncbi:MAG: electron transfer flavoprotein subunit alpha/FixB family protein [Eubacteriaceae bacterium]|nr:electron transfer flavoprotein subunit alpha/FixB family protein [Eubacteriaceae bacterium]